MTCILVVNVWLAAIRPLSNFVQKFLEGNSRCKSAFHYIDICILITSRYANLIIPRFRVTPATVHPFLEGLSLDDALNSLRLFLVDYSVLEKADVDSERAVSNGFILKSKPLSDGVFYANVK